MNIQTTKTTLKKSTLKAPSTNINDYKQKFRVHFAEYRTLGRRTVGEAWFAGQALNEIKARIHHGEFRLFLETEGISVAIARRFMALSREVQIVQIASFDSIDAAMKSLPAKVPSRPAVDPLEPSKEEIKGIEQEQDRHRAEVSEAEVITAHAEIKRLKALAPHAGPAPPPDDSLEREVKRSSETWSLLEASRRETKKLKRRLSAIKRDMADGKPVKDILAEHFGRAVQTALGVQDRG